MDPERAALTAGDRATIAEEEQLLERARASLERALAKQSREREAVRRSGRDGTDLHSVDALRALREEAQHASADDLPPLLLELGVRQRLAEQSKLVVLPELDAP